MSSRSAPSSLGAIEQLWQYPAKSMQGVSIPDAGLIDIGLEGDRRWAVRDLERGGIRGAKKLPGLMDCSARYVEGDPERIEITLGRSAGGSRTVRSDDGDVDEALSTFLGRRVALDRCASADDLDHFRRGEPDSDDLEAELRSVFGRESDEPLPDLSQFPPEIIEFESPPGTYVDVHPLHLLTTGSLRSLARLAPDSQVDVRRFRPNLLISVPGPPRPESKEPASELPASEQGATEPPEAEQPGPGAPEQATPGSEWPELEWVGRSIRVGSAVLDVVGPCPRCVMVTRGFDDLDADRRMLRRIVADAGQNLGVYATVREPGRVTVGDELTLLG